MTQARFAAGNFSEPQYPGRGQVLRNFALLSTDGKQVQLSDYRGRANLVLVLAGAQGSEPALDLLAQLASRQAEILEQEAQVIAVLYCTREQAQAINSRAQLPFVVLADSEGTVHRSFGALDRIGRPRRAVYVTDRYGEIFSAWRTVEGDVAPSPQDIVEWLEFVNRQCPECFPPEWPV
ncbi:MAG TPA: redoxin domain-containing protein [Terriglobales bacterium]|nr:redoxin domain-containing protein [Terriglobales bacterium]